MKRKSLKQQRGQVLIELALILPILLLFVFGITEFGRIYSAGLIVNHSAREGARLAAVGSSDAEIIGTVESASATLDLAKLEIGITPGEGSRQRGQEVLVKVSYPVPVIAPFISAITGENVTVKGQSVMRME